MPTKRYPLEANGPDRLELTWGVTALSKCTVKLDGVPILVLPLMQALKQGGQVTLSSGDVITVQKNVRPGADFDLLKNGQYLGTPAPMPTGAMASMQPGDQLALYALILAGIAVAAVLVLAFVLPAIAR